LPLASVQTFVASVVYGPSVHALGLVDEGAEDAVVALLPPPHRRHRPRAEGQRVSLDIFSFEGPRIALIVFESHWCVHISDSCDGSSHAPPAPTAVWDTKHRDWRCRCPNRLSRLQALHMLCYACGSVTVASPQRRGSTIQGAKHARHSIDACTSGRIGRFRHGERASRRQW